jgi:polar amino acid transport system substrate-binding protein
MKNRLCAGILAIILGVPLAAGARDLGFVTIDAAPWASQDKASGKPVGVFPDVVRELERRTGFTIRQTLVPFARIDHELEAGHQDCTIIVWNDSRARIVTRGELVARHAVGVVGRKGLSLRSYDDLRGLKLSALRGAQLNSGFDNDPTILKEYDSDYLLGIRKVAMGRLDGVVGAIPTILFLARKEGLEDRLGDRLMLGEIPLNLQCAQRSPNLDLMPALNQAIRDMRADGTIDRIKAGNSFM